MSSLSLAAGVAVAAAFVVALATTRLLIALGERGLAMDIPNARSLHRQPVPRSGGLAVAAGVLLGWGLAPGSAPLALGMLGLSLAAVSLLDDLRGLSISARLAAHLGVAVALVWWLGMSEDLALGLVAVVGVAWAVNLYNFMDGADGLAGGMAVIGFAFLAAAAWLAGNGDLAVAGAVVAAAAAGFLCFNFPPARIFLGDVGAIPLGFLAAALGLLGWRHGDWPAAFPLLVFSPFWVDATVTLTSRWMRGAKVWQAHRDHAYQRLVRLGLGHRPVVWLAYALMLVGGGLGLLALHMPRVAAWLGVAWCAGLAAGVLLVDRVWRRRGLDDAA